jgi:hypothetical protein
VDSAARGKSLVFLKSGIIAPPPRRSAAASNSSLEYSSANQINQVS